jgi:DNA-directed RNA polymerase specialized sigma24 family protein
MLKLLFIEDCDLHRDELRQHAAISGRPVAALLTAIDQLRARVREREARQKDLEDALDGVQAWIGLYERRLRQIAATLVARPADDPRATRLRTERAELERKLVRRHQQRAGLLSRTQRRKVTAPYKDIAALLNMNVGTVASQLSRLRKELASHPALREHLALLGSHDDA